MNVAFRTPAVVDAEPTERSFDLRQYLNFVWRQWKFIGAVTVLALVIAVIYLARATPLYSATTQVLLDPRREKAASDNILSDIQLDQDTIESQLAIIRSPLLLQRVVIKEGLPKFELQTGSQGAAGEDAKTTEAELIQNAIGRLSGALGVKRSGQAYVLDISITWPRPTVAGQLANAVADAYLVDQLDARFDAAKRASGWLSDRLVELRQQLRDSEEAVVKFRSDHG